jgi:hypothetical protein
MVARPARGHADVDKVEVAKAYRGASKVSTAGALVCVTPRKDERAGAPSHGFGGRARAARAV